jgi:thiamine-phosphate pyrophosphorylase
VAVAARASAAGADIVQVREGSVPDGELAVLVRRVVAAVDRSRTAVLVNDRVDVALAAEADGTHLRGDGVPASRVRGIAPDNFLIGRSVHTAAEARAAERDGGSDFLFFGTVYPSAGKPAAHPVAGIDALRDVCAATRLPVVAIGGVSVGRAPELAAAGAAGIAAIAMFADGDRIEADEMAALVRDTRLAFDTRRRVV